MDVQLHYLLFALGVHKTFRDKGAYSMSMALLEMGDSQAIQ